jgi:glycosyltransferase involved in cell wall biosynthesis
MLRVIYTPDIFSLQRVGGISRYFCELLSRMPIDVCLTEVPAGVYLNRYLRAARLKTGCYIPRLGPLGRYRLQFNHALCLRCASKHPSAIIHQTYYSEVEYPTSHPLVLTVADMIDQRFPEMSTAVPTSLKRRNCERADRIIAISDATKRDLVELFKISSEKITVVHLADSLPKLAQPKTQEANSEKYLLYVGRRGDYKNFGRLLEAFAASPFLKRHFHLVAFGGGSFSEEEKRAIERMNIVDKVCYIAGDDSALVRYYRNAAVLVYPSLYEGFGLPILEAMGQGCPVMCSEYGSLREVAGDAAAYFDAHQMANIRSVLEENLGDPDRLAELRQRGIVRHRLFSWEKCVDETLSVYREIAS